MHDSTAAPRKDSAAWHVHVISQVTSCLGNDRDATSQYLTTKQSRKQTENADAAVPVLPAFMQIMCSSVQQGVHRLQISTQSKYVAASS